MDLPSIVHLWQNLPYFMNPVAFSIAGFKVHWYGLMYLAAFATCYWLVRFRIGREERFSCFAGHIVDDFFFWMVAGVLVGARLGYVVLYHPFFYAAHPWEIFLPFDFSGPIKFIGFSGMSFHGGLAGALAGAAWYGRKHGLDLWKAADLFVPAAPLGYTYGRLGNFINGELYGRVTHLAVGMHFPLAPGSDLRHPSQLYEAFFEGVVLFFFLWHIKEHKWPKGTMLAFYLMGYGILRFGIEFVRQPDAHIGFVVGFLTMGQILCIAMALCGFLLWDYLRRRGDGSGGGD